MFSKSKIIEIIENDDHFNNHGRYAKDFVNDEMVMCYEYQHMTKLQLLLAFSGKEMTLSCGSSDIIVTIIADDSQQMLIKETGIYDCYEFVEFWIVDKNRRLTADMVWKYTG